MNLPSHNNKLYFLQGGGEMGELTRNFNWSETVLGTPDQWPQSLCTTVGLLLHSSFPMFLFWGDEFTCFYNDAYRPSLGKDGKHPAIGQNGKMVWPEIWDFIGPLINKVMTTGNPEYFENMLLPIERNGRLEDVYWTFSYSPAYGDDEKIKGVFVTCTETTSTIRAIRKNEENNRQLLALFEQAPVGVAIISKINLTFQMANSFYGEMVGRKPEKIIGKPLLEALPEIAGQGFDILLEKVIATGVPYISKEVPVDIMRNNRLGTIYVDLTYQPMHEMDNIISGVLVVATDVTEQVVSRKAIEESEEDLRSMVLTAPIGICVLDAATLISEIVNDSFIEVAGKPYEAIAGKFYWDTFAEAREYYEAALNDVVQKGISYYANEVELMLIRHGKEEIIYVTFVYTPIKNKEGEVKKVAVWVLENTRQVVARQKVEEEIALRTKDLADANNNLQKSNEELAQFAYIASHDLQEPLRKITTFTQLLEKNLVGKLTDQSKDYLDKISNSSSRMNKLIKDVLSYSQLVKEREAYATVDLNQILENIKVDYDLSIEQKGAILEFDTLPMIEAIPIQMAQLFGNIISNALKFSRKEISPVITIHSSILSEEERNDLLLDQHFNYYKIKIKDNGIGIKPEHTQQIFNIFQRLHRKSDFEGTGIGLAMCKKIVLNHHGDINASGSCEEGAVFNIFLPVKQL